MQQLTRLSHAVAEELGHYVYLYVDPRTGKPFYVGKGQRSRVLSHLLPARRSRKSEVLRDLKAAGLRPRIEILAHRLPSEEVALRIEAAVIDLLGLAVGVDDGLTNAVSGWNSVRFGREPLDELALRFEAKAAEIVDPVLLIRINRAYRPGMEAHDLYHKTRGAWKLGVRRAGARYGLAVYHGLVREAYEIAGWAPAGTTRTAPGLRHDPLPRRWEFTGAIAQSPVRKLYVGRSVTRYFPQGSQNPVVYVNC